MFVPTSQVVHVRGATSTAYALAEYTVRLLAAKERFIQNHFGSRRAKWYRRLVRAALFERYLLYTLAAKLTRSPDWEQRALQAQARYGAVRGAGLC